MMENKDICQELINKGPMFGKRHVQVALMFFYIAFSYAMRVNISVAIVAMTDQNSTNSNPDIPTYHWTDKSVILSSFYWGYVLLQVPAGRLCRTYGTRWFLAGTMALNAAACNLIPLFASLLGSTGVMICCATQGLAQGFVYPAVMVVLGQWVPLSERARLSTITLSGLSLSSIISMPISGYICSSWIGWPATFYIYGALGFAWILPWLLFGANSPEEHKSITDEERTYIQHSLNFEKGNKVLDTPWKEILTSLPVWAYIVANCGESWAFTALLTEMPTYINKIMKFDIDSNGLLSAAPYVLLFLFSYVCGFISDHMTNSGYVTLTTGRKLFTTLGIMSPAISLVILGFIPETAITLSIILLMLAVGLEGATVAGFQVSSIDLSPNFSGVIMGIANGSATVFSILSPLFVQLIVTDETDKLQWRVIFVVSAGVYFATNIFFLIFGSAEVQWWDSSVSGTKERKDTTMDLLDLERLSQSSNILTTK